MNFSRPFIERPIGTTLLALGLLLLGIVAYHFLPVSSLPSVEFATISVSASRPGADPETMAATIAAPIERRLGEIAGVTELTSVSSLGNTRITVQFDLSRNIDGAGRDVQAALNAAATDLPSDLPMLPRFRKMNPSAAPILILALTSDTMPAREIYDAADTIIAQRISQVDGVADVTVAGAEQPALRVRINPLLLSGVGLSIDDVRQAITNANALTPLGIMEGSRQAVALETNAQLRTVDDYKAIILKTSAGNVVRLSDVADVVQGTRNSRSAAMFNRKPAVLLIITKQPDANVIDTVDNVRALLPELRRWIPAGIDIEVLSDRTGTIRASVHDMQITLAIAVVLVMAVVFVFLRRGTPTMAAGVTVPLSLAGTCAAMWLAGFSINNLTLMALAVSVGFVVDDAIVMIENMYRNLEAGLRPMHAALEGAKQIGFTVVSISVSLLAAFIPLLFMGGVIGRLLREFSVTLAFAIIVSTVVSLSVTPMICAHFVRSATSATETRFDRIVETVIGGLTRGYMASLAVAMRHGFVMGVIMISTVVITVALYVKTPKGYFPQDDTGLIVAFTSAAPDVSYEQMAGLQRQVLEIVLADPAVSGVGSSVGATGFNPSGNQGRLFISLKPLAQRGLTTLQVVDRMRRQLARVQGISLFMTASQDIRVGGRQGRGQYQYTFWSPDLDDLNTWFPKILGSLQKLPQIVDANSDREQGGLQTDIKIDRTAAARLGVRIADIDNALNNAFAQRQISMVYTQRNQYRVVLEVDPRYQRDPSDIGRIFVPGRDGTQVPLSSLVTIGKSLAPLVVNHQGPFPSMTVSYNLPPNGTLAAANAAIEQAVAELRLPDNIRAEPAGDARAAASLGSAQGLLILAALLAVYIVLGVLYESLAHPLTIISTLPSAGLGAVLALQLAGMELSVIAFIGIILLIGIVKKNGIMLVDFALEAERNRGLSSKEAIIEAARERFRPILMTTLAALLGAVPLALAAGPGSELRRPLGIAIIGGLVVSQILTLYTTPMIYLLLDKLHLRLGGMNTKLPHSGGATPQTVASA